MGTVINTLDHRDLNEHPDFQDRNPSSENIAVYIYDQLKNILQHDRYSLYSVTVGETESSGLTYYGD